MLFKVTEFIKIKILKSVYYATFDCHINYVNTVWGLNKNSMNWLISQQKNYPYYEFWMQKCTFESTFFRHEIIKLPTEILTENCLLISRSTDFNLSSIFNDWFSFSSDLQSYDISRFSKGSLKDTN